jgi:hypothetical protein
MGVLFFYISLIASYFIIYPINNYPQPTSLQTISNNLNTEINSLRLLIKTKDENLKNLNNLNKINKYNYNHDFYY